MNNNIYTSAVSAVVAKNMLQKSICNNGRIVN